MAEQPKEKPDIASSEAAITQALEQSAQELKALALFYQARNRPQWAKETYSAFLRVANSEQNNTDSDTNSNGLRID